METSRRLGFAQRARGRWKPGATSAPKILPEPPTETASAGVDLDGLAGRYTGGGINMYLDGAGVHAN